MPQTVVLLHSAYGLRSAVLDFAEALRRAGHTVHTPDLYDGATFDDLDAAVAHRDSIGIPALMQRVETAVDRLPQPLVFGGFSMGIGPAAMMAAMRPGSRGAILMHGAFLPADFGIESWPASVPVQIHYARGDSETEAWQVEAMAEAVRSGGALAEVFLYEGGGHLFADPGLPDYDAASATAMLQHVLDFLISLDEEGVTSK